MENKPLNKDNLISIDGIKFSEELVLFNLIDRLAPESASFDLFQILRRHQLNMSYLTITRKSDNTRISFCVAADDQSDVELLLGKISHQQMDIEIIPSVGLVTLFPHQSRISIPGRVLSLFVKALLPVYGMTSSLSTLTFVTAFEGLDKAGETMKKYLNLPEGHAPFRPEFRLKAVSK